MLLLCLIGFATACENKITDANNYIKKDDNNLQGGEVSHKLCPCEFDVEPITIQGEARFFIDTFYDDLSINYMVWYNGKDIDNAYLTLRSDNNSMPIKVNICNFPDFAKEWYSDTGIIVYYEGIMYEEWCEELTLGCRGFCGTLILTKLTKGESK